MRKQYYECHITIEGPRLRGPNLKLQNLIESLGWKYSVIDGDIVLGPGFKYYATRHYNAKYGEQYIIDELCNVAEFISRNITKEEKVVRRKCEFVVFDDKKSGEPCNGGCPDCHVDDLAQ